jgi:multidrug efflux pump subunit AcrB
VRVTYDAASFGRMEDRVIAPLEDELSLLPEVERIVTNYTRNQVEMALHARPQTLDTILRQKLQIALSEAAKVLPEGTSEPELLAHDPLGTLLASPAGMRILADAFEIRLDPRRLDRYGLSMEQVAKKIRDDGLSSAPAPQDQGEELKPDLRQALAETVVLDQDPPVKLADVAEIHLRDQAPATGARVRVWPGPGQ